MTDAISGTRRQMRELVDGTIEVKVHIDPRFKADFNRLFPNIDAPVALAPLVKDFERREATVERKGGPISQWLGARCNDPMFWTFLEMRYGDGATPVDSADKAAAVVRCACGVKSRAEIDHDRDARERFEWGIREPFQKYLKGE